SRCWAQVENPCYTKRKPMQLNLIGIGLAILISTTWLLGADAAAEKTVPDNSSRILTPLPPATPRINGARIYGQRPGRPFLFTVPATGDRPMSFSASGLPPSLKLDTNTGRITGTVDSPGEIVVKLRAS